MGLNFIYTEGQTPLDEDEKEGLLITSITTHGELNELEQNNIEDAMLWIAARRKKFTVEEVLAEPFIKMLHKRMYGAVWHWAGDFRRTNKNIGVLHYEVPIELRQLIDDCKLWIDNSVFESDELTLRFKHRLVSIHCFANGNGRHSRLMADLMIQKLFKLPVFNWGINRYQTAEARRRYLQALRDADMGDYEPLIGFARS